MAPATIPGTGAVTVIRLSGPDAIAIAAKVAVPSGGAPLEETPGFRLRYCTVPLGDGSVLDEVLVSVFRAPRSYTGEDSVEISCHASPFIASEIVRLLCDGGARPAVAGEFTRRAFLAGRLDLAQAESVADVVASDSAAAHRVAMGQLRGDFSRELESLRGELVEMASLLELELDFAEEDVEFASRERLLELLSRTGAHVDGLVGSYRTGRAIRDGIPVAIVGGPNAGKSTLLNALLRDDRAIVSPIPGTTRDTVEDTMEIGGIRFRFIDTAGIRDTAAEIERLGIQRSLGKAASAQIVLVVVDRGAERAGALAGLSEVLDVVDSRSQEVYVLLNKSDLPASGQGVSPEDVGGYLRDRGVDARVMEISAKERTGVEDLEDLLCEGRRSLLGASGGSIVTNARHYKALSEASDALERVGAGLRDGTSTELVAEDLRDAIYHIGEVTRPVTDWEVLGKIFSSFCIGK